MMRIHKYKHYFTITDLNFSKLIFDLHDFNRDLVTHTMKLIKRGRGQPPKVINAVDKLLYIIETENPENINSKNIIRYPISLYNELLIYLNTKGRYSTDIKVITHKPHGSIPILVNVNKDLTPRDYQKIYIDKITDWDKNNVLVDLSTGRGKAVSVNTPIKIKGGWRPIGTIRTNDKVIGRDGHETVVTGMYPQGKLPLYKVTFADGRWVEAGLEHLWTIYGEDETIGLTKTTEHILSILKNNTVSIDLINPKTEFIDNYKTDVEYMSSIIKDNTYEVLLDAIPYNTYYEELCDDLCIYSRSLGLLCYVDKDYIDETDRKLYLLSFIKSNKLEILSIEYSRDEEAVCISVDNEDKLYVVKDYIVTHNTFISMTAISRIKKLFAIVVLPRYMDKWIADVMFLTDIKREEILTIQGLQSLIEAMTDETTKYTYKAYIISLTTIRLFVKSYLTSDLVAQLGLSPEMITEKLGIDTVLNDESHQEFFNVYSFMMYCNHRLTLGLTATLHHNDKHVNSMYELGFPSINRISNVVKANRYINVLSIRFRFRNRKLVRYKNHFGYNQPTFEKSIIKNSNMLYNYLDMLHMIATNIYFNRRKDKQKLIVFMGTVKMCMIAVDYFKRKHRDLAISKYTEEEDYEVIEKTDVIFSTMGSLSTAIDVPNLISTIQTVNVDSKQANTQSLGRLREKEGVQMMFAYIWSSDISQHKRYNNNRLQLFGKLAKSTKMVEYRKLI